MDTSHAFLFPKAEKSTKEYFVGVVLIRWFCSVSGVLVYGLFNIRKWLEQSFQPKMSELMNEGFAASTGLKSMKSHTWPATLLVANLWCLNLLTGWHTPVRESGCDDWRRGTDLSWIMGAECTCFTFVLHVAGHRWALTWDWCLNLSLLSTAYL